MHLEVINSVRDLLTQTSSDELITFNRSSLNYHCTYQIDRGSVGNFCSHLGPECIVDLLLVDLVPLLHRLHARAEQSLKCSRVKN